MNQFKPPVTKTFSLFPAVFTQIEVTFAFTHTEQFWCRRVPNFDRYVLIQTNQVIHVQFKKANEMAFHTQN